MKTRLFAMMALVLAGVLLMGPAVMAGSAIDEVLGSHQDELMSIKGVNSVMAMEIDGVPSIIVFIAEDADVDEDLIPAELDGYPVIVEVDYEFSIMPLGEDDEVVTDTSEETAAIEPETDDAGEEGAAVNTALYIGVGAVIIILLLVLLLGRKKGK